MSHEINLPKRKQAITQNLTDEFLVYDQTTKKAHCLNKTAADVWTMCDGNTTVKQMTAKLDLADDALVELALDDLGKAGLLEQNAVIAIDAARRETLRKMGMAAAIAVPLVVSILVPTPAQAAS